jgi:hypothetical protein
MVDWVHLPCNDMETVWRLPTEQICTASRPSIHSRIHFHTGHLKQCSIPFQPLFHVSCTSRLTPSSASSAAFWLRPLSPASIPSSTLAVQLSYIHLPGIKTVCKLERCLHPFGKVDATDRVTVPALVPSRACSGVSSKSYVIRMRSVSS